MLLIIFSFINYWDRYVNSFYDLSFACFLFLFPSVLFYMCGDYVYKFRNITHPCGYYFYHLKCVSLFLVVLFVKSTLTIFSQQINLKSCQVVMLCWKLSSMWEIKKDSEEKLTFYVQAGLYDKITIEHGFQRREAAFHVDMHGRTFQTEEISSAVVLSRNMLSIFRKQLV